MLFEELDRIKRKAILSTVILVIAGIMLLVLPDTVLPFFNGLMGIGFLVISVDAVFTYLASKKALIHCINLTVGLLCGILGLSLLAFDNLLTSMLYWLVSVLPIGFGLYGIYHALMFARRSGRKGWWVLIILSVTLILFGGFALFNPWVETAAGTMHLIGGTMMYTALISGLRLVWLWPIHNTNGGEAHE